jgi:sulfur carrier protein
MITVTVSGEKQELAGSITLAELLKLNRVEQPDMVSIQLNGEFVYKDGYETPVKEGDEIDFLYFMGGGGR